jgi:hypothetical protein
MEGLAWAHVIAGGADWALGRMERAASNLRSALSGFDRLGALWGLSAVLFMSGLVAAAHGRQEGCVRLLAASEALRLSIGVGMFAFMENWLANASADAVAAIGPQAYARAWEAGSALTRETDVAEALQQVRPASKES